MQPSLMRRTSPVVLFVALTGCTSGPASYVALTPRPSGEAYSCAFRLANELQYTVTSADKEGGFVTAEKQRRSTLLTLTGRDEHDRLTVSVYDDSTSGRRKLRVTAATIHTDHDTHGTSITEKAPSDDVLRDANAIVTQCGEGPVMEQSRADVPTTRATAAKEPRAELEPASYSPIVELRQYTTRPGKRDILIDMFDMSFVGPQEAAGIKVLGQFRNLDDPDKFVWLRGFPDMASRAASLKTFYTGPEWRSRRDSANATIIDNDIVLLLHPVHPGSGFGITGDDRPRAGAVGSGKGLIVATIYHIDPTAEKEREFVRFFEQTVAPLVRAAGAPVMATFLPERSENTFPGLPVREGEHVFVWFSRFADATAYERFKAALSQTPLWRDSVATELNSKVREPTTLRLSPTARSLLHD